MTALKDMLQKIVGPSTLDESTLVAAGVAALVFVVLMSIHKAIEALPAAPSGIVYPLHSGP